MSSPKIKIYQLSPGYSETGDNDIQYLQNDELVPVVEKPLLIGSVMNMSPIVPVVNEECFPIDFTGGRLTEVLEDQLNGYFKPETSNWATAVLWEVEGALAFIILDGVTVVSPEDYTLSSLGVKFATDFVPVGALTCTFYEIVAPAATTYWALPGDNPYLGDNPSFNRVLATAYNSAETVIEMEQQPIVPAGVTKTHLHFPATTYDVVRVSYAYVKAKTRYFCGAHDNWVGDHYNMNPDLFVGTFDYPGDQYLGPGDVPFEPGLIPKYREPNTYQVAYRSGLVTFPEVVDSVATPVKALYAYLAGVDNVDGMVLTYQGVIATRHAYAAQLTMTTTTRLTSLNRGEGVDLAGGLTITDRSGTSFNVVLTANVTVQDVITDIQAAATTAGRTITVTVGTNGLVLVDGIGGGSNFIVAENGGTSAVDLGILQSVASNTITGSQVNWPDLAFPSAHSKRIVGRDDSYIPVNVYVKDTETVLKPQITTIAVPDTLTVKLS